MGSEYNRKEFSGIEYLNAGNSIMAKMILNRMQRFLKERSDFFQNVRVCESIYHKKGELTATIKVLKTVDFCIVKENQNIARINLDFRLNSSDLIGSLNEEDIQLLRRIFYCDMKKTAILPKPPVSEIPVLPKNVFVPLTQREFAKYPGHENVERTIRKMGEVAKELTEGLTILYKVFEGKNGNITYYTKVMKNGVLLFNSQEYTRNGHTNFRCTEEYTSWSSQLLLTLTNALMAESFSPIKTALKDSEGYEVVVEYDNKQKISDAMALMSKLNVKTEELRKAVA